MISTCIKQEPGSFLPWFFFIQFLSRNQAWDCQVLSLGCNVWDISVWEITSQTTEPYFLWSWYLLSSHTRSQRQTRSMCTKLYCSLSSVLRCWIQKTYPKYRDILSGWLFIFVVEEIQNKKKYPWSRVIQKKIWDKRIRHWSGNLDRTMWKIERGRSAFSKAAVFLNQDFY